MPDLVTADLMLTLLASASLLTLWAASAALLPWSEQDFEETEDALRRLRWFVVPEPAVLVNASSRTQH